MKSRPDLLKAVLRLSVLLLFFLAGLLLLHAWEKRYNKISGIPAESFSADEYTEGRELTYYNGAWYAAREDLETILVLGVDKYAQNQEQTENAGYEQADFLLLLVLEPEEESFTAIQLNRDTMVQYEILTDDGMPVRTVTGQLALAHAYGGNAENGCKNTMNAVSHLLYGVKIDHYVSLSMDGVAELNDLAGGVTLEVMDDFTGIDDTLVQGGTITLKGEQALTYVRARKGLENSSNLHRMERQRQYLNALKEQLTVCADQNSEFILESLITISEYLVSDCTIEQLSNLAAAAADYSVSEYLTLDGEAVKGQKYMEFYVNEQSLQSLVMELFYELSEKA